MILALAGNILSVLGNNPISHELQAACWAGEGVGPELILGHDSHCLLLKHDSVELVLGLQ